MSEFAARADLTVGRVITDGVTTRVTRITAGAGGDLDLDGDGRRDAEDGGSSAGSRGRAFVLVPGVGVAATYFEFLAPALAEHGDVYALDLPGFAGLPRPEEQPTAAFFARHVVGVLDRYDLTDPVLIGHSMGTQVVAEVLAVRPGLSHAVLVSPVINEAEASAPVQAVRFAQSAVRETPHLAVTALSAYILCGVVYFLTVLPHLLRYRLSERIGLGDAALLLIRGELDRTSPRRFHSRLAREAKDARTWEIEEAAHSIINAHAIGVAELTVRHVEGTLPRRGRMAARDAEVPPARHADLSMLLGATGSRIAEWVSALRGDERGVARAKREHARILWRAYAAEPRRR